MVWEQNSKAVLMLNKIIEKNHVKCYQYWPLGDSINTMMFPDVGIKVKYISKTESSDYTTRILKYGDKELYYRYFFEKCMFNLGRYLIYCLCLL